LPSRCFATDQEGADVKRIATLIVLVGASSVVAAPAPLQKTPRSPERVWQVDLGPLLAAPKTPSFSVNFAIDARHPNGTYAEGVRFTVWQGRIEKVRITEGFLISVLGQPTAEGMKQALTQDLRESMKLDAAALGDVIEFRAIRGTPVSKVIVSAVLLDE